MKIIDYNGTGRWSRQDIQERYTAYARQLKVSPPFDLKPLAAGSSGVRLYTLFDEE